MPRDVFDEIEEARKRAAGLRAEEMARFHVGDVVYPLMQYGTPDVWGTVIDVSLTTHKVTINMNGVVRQYDPEELLTTNPELRPDTPYNRDLEEKQAEIAERVEKMFTASRIRRIARRIADGK